MLHDLGHKCRAATEKIHAWASQTFRLCVLHFSSAWSQNWHSATSLINYFVVSYFESQVTTLDYQKRGKELVMKRNGLYVNHMILLDDNGQPTGHLIDQLDVDVVGGGYSWNR